MVSWMGTESPLQAGWMTLAEAVAESGLDRSGIARACRDGTIRGAQLFGRVWTFPRSSWDAWRATARPGNPAWRVDDEE
jgi:hypothetical protein